MQHHGVTPGGVLGLSWGCSWSSWALLVLSLCSRLLLDCSWSDCPGSRPPKPERTARQGVAPWNHTWGCCWALLGSSGLPLRSPGAFWLLLVAPGCSQVAPGATSQEAEKSPKWVSCWRQFSCPPKPQKIFQEPGSSPPNKTRHRRIFWLGRKQIQP